MKLSQPKAKVFGNERDQSFHWGVCAVRTPSPGWQQSSHKSGHSASRNIKNRKSANILRQESHLAAGARVRWNRRQTVKCKIKGVYSGWAKQRAEQWKRERRERSDMGGKNLLKVQRQFGIKCVPREWEHMGVIDFISIYFWRYTPRISDAEQTFESYSRGGLRWAYRRN